MSKRAVMLSAFVVLSIAALVNIIFFSSAQASCETARPAHTPKLIIDPGHGGVDGGAVSGSGTHESEINLAIAIKLDQIVGLLGQSPIMTRNGETLDYSAGAGTIHAKKAEDLKRRVGLVNGTEDALLISIHQNKYTDGGPSGAEVLYAPTDGSKEIAGLLQSLLIEKIDPTNRRVATKIPASIYLMNNIRCPAVLVECGFLSNVKEEALLKTDKYQLKLAAVIAAGYFISINGGGTDES